MLWTRPSPDTLTGTPSWPRGQDRPGTRLLGGGVGTASGLEGRAVQEGGWEGGLRAGFSGFWGFPWMKLSYRVEVRSKE